MEHKEPILQAELLAGLRQAGLGGALDEGVLAVAAVDLTQPETIAYAGVNDDLMLYAASLPKIGILLGFIQLVNEGGLGLTPRFEEQLHQMITFSNNAYASWGFDEVGLDNLERVVRAPAYCLYEPPQGGLWVGRAYRRHSVTRRDPLFNISHGATARQTARFYVMLERGELVSHYWSERMRALMGPPGHHHKFVAGLKGRQGVQFIARKSGTWRDFHADSALVQHYHCRYIAVGLSHMADGEYALRKVAAVIDDVIAKGAHRRFAEPRNFSVGRDAR